MKHIKIHLPVIILLFALFPTQPRVLAAQEDPVADILIPFIKEYNSKAHRQDLINGAYRGEEGILGIQPDVGRALGLKVLINQNYLDSKYLFREAEKSLASAKKAMMTRRNERFPGEHVQAITKYFLIHKNAYNQAQRQILEYRAELHSFVDERLDEDVCIGIMGRLLGESLRKTDRNLRDGLARFYNLTRGIRQGKHPLTPENVLFVNTIFRQFLDQAPKEVQSSLDLDRDHGGNRDLSPVQWKVAVDRACTEFGPIIEKTLENHKADGALLDPLLIAALMKRESGCDPDQVSSVGAAGLMQIMPQTAQELGMEPVFRPPYFDEAINYIKESRRLNKAAFETLQQIGDKDNHTIAKKARQLAQKSMDFQEKKDRLFVRYKKELLKKRDNRLEPAAAIKFGFKYFADLMKIQNGDISLALASYNAGPHRVKQYDGIPPYAETVHFRNAVLKYYREFLKKVDKPD